MPDCNLKNKKSQDPRYTCNKKTGRWVLKSRITGQKALKVSAPIVQNRKRAQSIAQQKKPKTCPPDKIINPATGRCVSRTGAIGRNLLAGVSAPTVTVPKPTVTKTKSPIVASTPVPPKKNIKAQSNDKLEQQMVKVVNLKPGENTELLHLQVYLVDLKKDGPFTANPMKPGLKWINSPNQPCRWTIGDSYYDKALKDADFGVFAICDDGNYSGYMSFAIGKILDAQSCYIHLICNAEQGYPINLKVPFGEIMLLSLLNHFYSLGVKHAFNHASNIDLVPHYARNKWSIMSEGSNCDDKDDIAEQFNVLPFSDTKAFVEDLESKGTVKRVKSGYPMKLCNYNFNEMFGRLLSLSQKKYKEAVDKGIDLSKVCDFA